MQNPYLLIEQHKLAPLEEGNFAVKNEAGLAWSPEDAKFPLCKDEIVISINFLNSHYEVLNTDKFGPANESKFIIVVQVHTRIEYLKYLISSLEQAKGIENGLLIFSHDYFSSEINNIIRNITFCRVMQILYPYPVQLFPTSFPGQAPDDCGEKMTKSEAERVRCRNWAHPDKYGHYRVAKLTQIKHHWWWKMNYVFDGVMKRFSLSRVWVVLLEEDHYVSPDFLHVMELITQHKDKLCSFCQVISLGIYLKNYANFKNDLPKLGIYPWFSSKHNMGLAMNEAAWNQVKNCSTMFCTYDDYNWDWTLMHLSAKCFPSKWRVIAAKAPRVLHIGDCGVHTHRCAVHNAAEKARELFKDARDLLFPKSLKITEVSKRMLKPSRENGGWGDIRDHLLCLNNSVVTLSEPVDFINGALNTFKNENLSRLVFNTL
uniref:Alpha-1,6-mannosyl-glycoprotein 2-beta-N-acetylglucosaminyltransferase n=1 Tax=Syphacia muris TaxID=451379 RepID=A0A0N5AD62_9BILA